MTAGAPSGAAPSTATSITESPTDQIAEALGALARGARTDLAGLLHDVESHAMVDGTKVTAHCHCIQLDAHGRPKTQHLVRAIAEQVLDYAIPRREITEALSEAIKTRSGARLVRLHNEARKLFTDIASSGEGGELLLFVLAEKLLQLPQLICKMDLKTNVRMHVHGADGLHAGVDTATGNLLLYWGESKIYSDIGEGVRKCLASIAPTLTDYSAGERDLQLLQRYADLENPSLEAALKKFLDPASPEFNQLEFRGLCLVGFDCNVYPSGPSTRALAVMAQEIATLLPDWKKHVSGGISAEKLDAFAMHFLFVPFPSVAHFRTALRKELGIGAASGDMVGATTQPGSEASVGAPDEQAPPATRPPREKAARKVKPAKQKDPASGAA